MQPQAQVQILCNLLDFGMTAQEAISAARFNHIDAAKVALEPEFPQAVRDQLSRRGPPDRRRNSGELRRRSRDCHRSRIRSFRWRLGPAQRRLRLGILISDPDSAALHPGYKTFKLYSVIPQYPVARMQ